MHYLNNINFNNLLKYNNVYKENNTIKNTNVSDVKNHPSNYPVFLEAPYGINKKPYIKILESKLPTGDKFCAYRLINGQTITIVQKEGTPIIKTAFKVGSMDEPDGKEGISHIIEHSIFHESKNYKDIEQSIKDIGGISNGATYFYYTNYYIQLANNDKETLKKAADIEADMIYNPKFSKLEKEKKIVIKESAESEADENCVNNLKKCKNLFSINKPDVINITAGNEKSVNNITKDDMFKYHQTYYIPANSTTSVISSFEPDEIIEIISNSFLKASENVKNHPIPRRQYNLINHTTRSDMISKEKDIKDISFSFILPEQSITQKAASCMFSEWIYNNTAFCLLINDEYDNNMSVNFSSKVFEDNEYKMFEKLKEILASVSKNSISAIELEKLKKETIERYGKRFNDNQEITQTLTDDFLLGGYYYPAMKQAINNLTIQDIAYFAKSLDMTKCSMNVIHPKETTKKDLENNIKEYRGHITPFVIPKTFQNIDISKNLTEYNLTPYCSEKVLNTTLPDNTNLTFLNSKNDKCEIIWELENPNLSSYNPAIKYVMQFLQNGITENIGNYLKQSDIQISAERTSKNKISLTAKCDKKDIDTVLSNLKRGFDMEFYKNRFQKHKQDALMIIQLTQELDNVQAMFLADKLGKNFSNNYNELSSQLENLTCDEAKKYYNQLIANSYSTVVVKAPFKKDDKLINKIASAIYTPEHSFRPGRNNFEIFNKTNTKCYIKEKQQSNYGYNYNFKTNYNKKDYLQFWLLTEILNKRLFDLLREKQGLAYSTGAFFNNYCDFGIIQLYINTDLKKEEDIKKIYSQYDKEIQKLLKEPIEIKELNEAKNRIKMQILEEANNEENILQSILQKAENTFGLAQHQNNLKMIDSISAQDILNTAKYAFKNKPDILIESDKKTIKENMEYFKSLGEVVEG